MGSPKRHLPVWDPIAPGGPNLSGYSDRVLSAEEAVARIWPYLPSLGITRVARQTGLDRVGIPCWAAFRPNSKSLAGAQGKGLTDAAACASAVMEAAEVAISEAPMGERHVATANALSAAGLRWYDPERLLPFGTKFDTAAKTTWLSGYDLMSGESVLVPHDAVDFDGERTELTGICKTTNGLASGSQESEAVFHALCELVERDGTALWSLLPDEMALGTAIDPAELKDPYVERMSEMIADAGMSLSLLNQTSDLGIPIIMAVIGPRDGWITEVEVTAGYGAHPVAARAAVRAITEAAQSRVTMIAASRDDIHSSAFKSSAADINVRLLNAAPAMAAPKGLPMGTPPSELLAAMKAALAAGDVGVTVVPIARDLPISVVKVLSPDLEDRAANINWRPGRRAFDAVERL